MVFRNLQSAQSGGVAFSGQSSGFWGVAIPLQPAAISVQRDNARREVPVGPFVVVVYTALVRSAPTGL